MEKVSEIADSIINQLKKQAYQKGERIIFEDFGKKRTWGTIKKIMRDKIKILSDENNRLIEIPISNIVASNEHIEIK
jgi:hypothetical protein